MAKTVHLESLYLILINKTPKNDDLHDHRNHMLINLIKARVTQHCNTFKQYKSHYICTIKVNSISDGIS